MPYRDEVEALRARETALESELAETRRLRAASERRALPVLDQLRVASPCPAKWEDMIGDDKVRFCGTCAKNVYDLSALTRAEAEAFVARHASAGPVCVTFRRRADGKVLTADCPVGARRRRFGIGAIALAATATAAAAFGIVGPTEPQCQLRAPAERGARSPKELEGSREHREGDGTSVRDTAYATGVMAVPDLSPRNRSHRITGCVCAPGDPLCSCL